MSDAVQEPCQSLSATLSTLLIARLARARAVYIPSAAAARGRSVVRVRRMRVASLIGVRARLNVRHIARGEIRYPATACGVPVITVSLSVNCSLGRRRITGTNVHSRGVLVSDTFVLLHFEDAPFHGRAYVEVPRASAPRAVHGVAGSRARFRVRSSDIAEPAAAGRLLERKNFFQCRDHF